jgi:hypothetical protein
VTIPRPAAAVDERLQAALADLRRAAAARHALRSGTPEYRVAMDVEGELEREVWRLADGQPTKAT